MAAAFNILGTPAKDDSARWEQLFDKFSALILRQVQGGREAREEWRRRYAAWRGGMKGIRLAIEGTLTPLSGMPRYVPARQAQSYRHHKDTWCMSNLFLVDSEGTIVDGNVFVPGCAADESMFKEMSFYKCMQIDGMKEWGG